MSAAHPGRVKRRLLRRVAPRVNPRLGPVAVRQALSLKRRRLGDSQFRERRLLAVVLLQLRGSASSR
jgi:hypothetical protein